MSSKAAKGQEPIPHQALLDENHALQDEVQSLRARLAEAEELRRAISEGDLDALVIPGPEGEMIFTLNSADHAYRVLVETMNEGTATLTYDGTILYCNRHFAELLRMPLHAVVGTSIYRFIVPENAIAFKALMQHERGSGEINLRVEGTASLPVYMSISSLQAEGSPSAWCLVVTDLTEQKKNEEILAAERLARSIIEQAAEGIIVCDTSGRIIRFSNAIYKICECDPTFQQFEKLMDLQFSEGAKAGESILPVSSALKGSSIFGMEATLELKNSWVLHLLLNSGPLKNTNQEIIGCVVTLTDFTERKRSEAMREAINSINQVIYSTLDFGKIMQNTVSEASKAFGCETAAISLRKNEHWVTRYVHGFPDNVIGMEMDDREEPHAVLAIKTKKPVAISDAFNDERVNRNHMRKWGVRSVLVIPLTTRDAIIGVIFFNFHKSIFEFDKSHIDFAVQLAASISLALENSSLFENLNKELIERKKAEEALKKAHDNLENLVKARTSELEEAYKSLKESENSLAEAQKMAHIGNWDLDLLTGKTHWSDETYRIFGFSPQEFDLTYDKVLGYVHPDDLDYVANSIKKACNGKPCDIVYRVIFDDGEERIVNTHAEVILDEKNTPARIRGTVQDITERKKAEEALAKIEIYRKQEIHHRIKNNLQVISSLLDLQAEKFNNRECIKDSEVMEAFRESQNRVISMALIHEELYKGGEIDTLDFSLYIEELARNLFLAYRLGNTDTTLNMDLEENLFFDMDTAIPLGMIVNELVSNSLKHAFIGRDKGEIRIKLRREDRERVNRGGESKNEDCKSTGFILIVSDNGIGISENLEIENLDSLGFQLVASLADQLDGEFELNRSNGTEFIMRFAVTEKN